MKIQNLVPRISRRPAHRLAVLCGAILAVLLCAGAGMAQCSYSLAPGQIQSLNQASYGDATPLSISSIGTIQGGNYRIQQYGGYFVNDASAVAGFTVPSGTSQISVASAYGQLNYLFCVSGNPNDVVSVTVSAQVHWNGVLYTVASVGLPGGAQTPSATISLGLIDLGTNGSGVPVLVATASPLQTQLSPGAIKSVSTGGTVVSGSAPVVLNANIVTGHVYSVQYQVDCEAPAATVVVGAGCDFGSDVAQVPPLDFLGTNNYTAVDSLSVSVGQDIYGAILSVKADVDSLSSQISANRQAIAAANLTAEQETAQLLGTLNEIKTLLSASGTVPPAHGANVNFTAVVNPSTLTITPGQSGTSALTVTPLGGPVNTSVSFTCVGLPAGSTCTFTPATVVPGANPATTSVTLRTSGSAQVAPPFERTPLGPVLLFLLALAAPLGIGLALPDGRWHRWRWAPAAFLMAVLGLAALMIACAAGGNVAFTPTSVGRSTVIIHAKAGSVDKTTTITLMVR
jgi:hypothetical protein